eukprot:658015-Amphidinium_carterae.1
MFGHKLPSLHAACHETRLGSWFAGRKEKAVCYAGSQEKAQPVFNEDKLWTHKPPPGRVEESGLVFTKVTCTVP